MSAALVGDFGPPPADVDLSENQDARTYGAVITIMIIGTMAVGLRVVARMTPKHWSFAADDYLILAALIFAYGTGVCTFVGVALGNGKHMWALTFAQFDGIWRNLFAYVIIYTCTVTCTKASILFFYKRIFNLRWSFYFCMLFILGYFITIIITVSVSCRPLPYFWEQYTDPTAVGTCIDVPRFFYANGISAMIVDIIVLLVPLPIVWKLQMPATQKLAVVGILLLGGFVCIASIVRITALDRNVHASDATWAIAPVFVWSCVEPFIGIVCACLPTFAPFFRRWWGVLRTSADRTSDPESARRPSAAAAAARTTTATATTETKGHYAHWSSRSKYWGHLEAEDEMVLTQVTVGVPAGKDQNRPRSKGDDGSGSEDDVAATATMAGSLRGIEVKRDVAVTWASIDEGRGS